ncbi:MAG: hypothetical protein KC561_18685, partial [Myxococcales bacterium]|nr:hypothetical protein [Myxococcales bacterium]
CSMNARRSSAPRDPLRILFIHPEGNVRNNPHLFDLTRLLAENGHTVSILAPPKTEAKPARNVHHRLLTRDGLRFLRQLSKSPFRWYLAGSRLARWMLPLDVDLIVGVDPLGIIIGSALADSSAALGYLSYEIEFSGEVSWLRKRTERLACRKVSFAIVQDRVRAQRLSEQTGISIERSLLSPVAGTGIFPGVRNELLHTALGIPRRKRVALFAGSLTRWSMAPELADTVDSWPEDWVLVFHERYGRPPAWLEERRRHRPGQIFVSDLAFSTPNELVDLMHASDLGLAFYRPTYDHPTTGKNLSYIGMASGKIGAYLRAGLPVATNEIGEMADHVRAHNLGITVSSPEHLGAALRDFDPEPLRSDCLRFFESTLDLQNSLAAIESTMSAAASAARVNG